ncbi:MAG: hypothetical protein PF447_09780 [Spirochaetaceae bacterium]|jgi:aspartokinase|nr:hypothetical protein [Spirochaetaceae bacterium]
MKVLKFGGSSVADAKRISNVIEIINSSEDNKYIIFSAMKGNAEINILAVAQGSTEKNISFVIEGKNREIALKCVHKTFLRSKG